jgi:hypothetical protein
MEKQISGDDYHLQSLLRPQSRAVQYHHSVGLLQKGWFTLPEDDHILVHNYLRTHPHVKQPTSFDAVLRQAKFHDLRTVRYHSLSALPPAIVTFLEKQNHRWLVVYGAEAFDVFLPDQLLHVPSGKTDPSAVVGNFHGLWLHQPAEVPWYLQPPSTENLPKTITLPPRTPHVISSFSMPPSGHHRPNALSNNGNRHTHAEPAALIHDEQRHRNGYPQEAPSSSYLPPNHVVASMGRQQQRTVWV